MNLIKNRKLKTKLSINIVITTIMLIGLGATSFLGFRHVADLSDNMVDNNVAPMREIATIQTNMAQINIDILTMFDTINGKATLIKDIDSLYAANDEALHAFKKANLTAEDKKQLAYFEEKLADMKSAASSVISDTSSALDDAELLGAQNRYYQNVKTKFDDATKQLSVLNDMNYEEVEKSSQAISDFGVKISLIFTAVIVAMLISLFIFNAYITKVILKGIRHLQTAVHKVSSGDLSYRSTYNGRDELGDITNDLNEMSENLRLMIEDVKKASTDVKASSDNVIISSEIISAMTTEMDIEMKMMGEQIQTQIGSMKESTEAMDQMTGGVQNVAEYALKVSDLTKDSAEKTNDGIAVINNLVSQMDRISGVMRSSTDVVSQLVNRVGEVEKALDTVTNIADQTNLLALNAAIESARAGEHGRGFAVVAEEVRKLAEQSRLAVVDINTVLKKIQTESKTTIEVMNTGLSESEAGQKIISETEATFSDLLNRVNDISLQMQNVSQETEEMAAGIEEVNTSISDVTEISNQIGEKSTAALEFAEVNKMKVDELVVISEEMQKISGSLEGYVANFNTEVSEEETVEEEEAGNKDGGEPILAENV
ncbi:methyl-accepting chemotaxis protein [Listeria ivanovii]|uniref:Methyl-accepting chemotaxis protein n=2 Tax=Listeria ivanovii TaxID=1638 RepID=A0ABS1G7U0_LISIV|nr:methyl-accepting chemotaxis protein [Listeria ivanovii]AIS59142.1 chemotaxis protein [Listeria ivanovii subsp. londoniensis]MBK1962916.1 methyl-accepting chemotaxis protein [Listeria ivanovii subsp. londoniensis]MBK2002400.1 methyl-accepting chemotaxis protein [Listeria ivanovii subsp. londoniensis]MBM5607555.1 methyl-accepting chemotaxis protein [Listeria ivanovii]MBM5635886.1 methyl-accepting chemotaxis protein [Listeria ivanovii]